MNLMITIVNNESTAQMALLEALDFALAEQGMGDNGMPMGVYETLLYMEQVDSVRYENGWSWMDLLDPKRFSKANNVFMEKHGLDR